jgi:outer membrane protein assembly factor BamD (BamD/ComL family)
MRVRFVSFMALLVGAALPGCRSTKLPTEVNTLYRYAVEADDAGRKEDALKAFSAFRKQHAGDPRLEEIRFRQVDAYYETERIRRGVNETREVLKDYPLSRHLIALEKRLFTTGVRLIDEDTGGFLGIKHFLAIEPEGVDVLGVLLESFKKGQYADAAQRKIGLWAMERKDYDRAILEFEHLAKDYPQSEWKAVADFNVAHCRWLKSRGPRYDREILEKAKEEYQKYVDLHPEGSKVVEAQSRIRTIDLELAEKGWLIGEWYRNDDRFEAARLHYKMVTVRYPETVWATKARERLQELDASVPHGPPVPAPPAKAGAAEQGTP